MSGNAEARGEPGPGLAGRLLRQGSVSLRAAFAVGGGARLLLGDPGFAVDLPVAFGLLELGDPALSRPLNDAVSICDLR